MPTVLFAILNLLAGLASILGLYFSIAAWHRAGEATQAAREAKQAVREATAIEELRRLAGNANEMKREIQDGHWRTARLRCDDLAYGMGFGKQRWRRLATLDAMLQIEFALGKVKVIARAISGDPVDISDETRSKLLSACHDIVIKLADVAGRMEQKVEGRQNG
jgi:hypothetical protein